VMIAGMLAPLNLGPDYGAEFAAAYQRVVDRYGLPFSPFFLDGLVNRPELLQRDGIHPNPAGVEVVVARILPSVEAGCDRPPLHRKVERRCDGVPLPAQRLAHKLLTILGISSRERSCGITSPRA